MHTNIDSLFEGLWQDYIKLTPAAQKIHQLLGKKDKIVNDHIALRTFNLPKVNLHVLAAHFETLGYVPCGDYHFEAKKLNAKHYEHPNPALPKVFISELMVDKFSQNLRNTIEDIIDQMDSNSTQKDEFLYSGRHWNMDTKTYQRLLTESEYAAWVAAFGYRANHFTVSVNHLSQFNSLQAVNECLKQQGFILNDAGGEIKGGPNVLLAQSSTMADKVEIKFDDKTINIPSCFYEFALRYPKDDGKLYNGFVASSADKIFESTHAKDANVKNSNFIKG